jgi:SAM-dependent methyltransferase
MSFFNVYQDEQRAVSCSKLQFPGTYYLAFRDLPSLLGKHAKGGSALDFGCGAGRSTRFLRDLGFEAVGVDISPHMIRMARSLDPDGDYRLIGEGDLGGLAPGFDAALSAFTFDNIPERETKLRCLSGIGALLAEEGVLVNLVSSPDIYRHEWASFSTRDFPGNLSARSGDRVRIVIKDVEDRRPVEDVIFYEEDYLDLYAEAGLELVEAARPLGREDEAMAWVSETSIAPWAIYVLKKAQGPR